MSTHTVEFIDAPITITVSESETILQACLREGINQEFSCRVGMCLACSAKIIEGTVIQPGARGLTEAQAEDYALTCMARPQSDLKLKRGCYPDSITP